jgi:putative flippase GtrA
LELLRTAARYGLAGLANTLLGFGLIMFCDSVLRLRPEIANGLGYAAGWLLSYALNRAFVFRSRGTHRVTGVRYLIAVAAAFLANQLVLQAALRWVPPSPIGHATGQAAGVVVYTGVLFVLCVAWVFRSARPAA